MGWKQRGGKGEQEQLSNRCRPVGFPEGAGNSRWEEARATTPQCPAATRVCWEDRGSGCWCKVVRGLRDRLKQEQGLGKLWQRRLWEARSYSTSLTYGGLLGSGKGWQAAGTPAPGGRWHADPSQALAGGTGSCQARVARQLPGSSRQVDRLPAKSEDSGILAVTGEQSLDGRAT